MNSILSTLRQVQPFRVYTWSLLRLKSALELRVVIMGILTHASIFNLSLLGKS